MKQRVDSIGMFWTEEPVVKIKKEKVKRTPPARFWEDDDYLPNLQEALNFKIDYYTDEELVQAAIDEEPLLWDIECYPNYFAVGFRGKKSKKVVLFEMYEGQPLDIPKLRWVMHHFLIIGFNTIKYDLVIAAIALAGASNIRLKDATWQIIVEEMRGYEVLRMRSIKPLEVNSIDLIEVAPLSNSLKMYAGMLHTRRLQDLPFHPETFLTVEQRSIVRWYLINDLDSTDVLHEALLDQLSLRVEMSNYYGIDLRSKSDAQIAEAVIMSEVMKFTGRRIKVPEIPAGTSYRYNKPANISFKSDLLNWVLAKIESTNFVVGNYGIDLPKEIKDLEIHIGDGVYRMGIGGLHSSESKSYHAASSTVKIKDIDVESFYPRLILSTGLNPDQIGEIFAYIYRQIVDKRVAAKRAGDVITAESLKITINGTFGKLGSIFSKLYAPHLMIQTTVGGQLYLLMLIERGEMAGFKVISANTDGVTFMVPVDREAEFAALIKQWEADTSFKTEETEYRMVCSRDVNNYIAVKTDGKVKLKGVFADPWRDPKRQIFRMHKNPTNQICIEAIEMYLVYGKPMMETITASTDIRKFVTLRKVNGGAVKDGVYLGKTVRWYYAKEETGEIIYAKTGNKVAMSDSVKPLMQLPDQFPEDLDHERYLQEAIKMLQDTGYPY